MVGMAGRRDDVVRCPRAGRWAGFPAGRPNRPAAGRFGVWVRVGIGLSLVDQVRASYPKFAGRFA
jgi:hypothetical protein